MLLNVYQVVAKMGEIKTYSKQYVKIILTNCVEALKLKVVGHAIALKLA